MEPDPDHHDYSHLHVDLLSRDLRLASNSTRFHSYCSLFWTLLLNSFSATLYLLTASIFTLSAINYHFISIVSPKNPNLLAGVALGTTWLDCTTLLLISSLNTGLISLCAQAFGARNYKLMGLYFHRSILGNSLVLVSSFLLLAFSPLVFEMFGISPEVNFHACSFIYFSYAACFFYMIFDTLKNYLTAHGISAPQAIVQILVVILHWMWCDVLVARYGMGIAGIAIAFTITQATGAILLTCYIMLSEVTRASWYWFTEESMRKIWRQLKFEAPFGAILYFEWIAYEILVLAASSYEPREFDGFMVFLVVIEMIITFPKGLGITLNTYSARAIGERDEQKSKKLLRVALMINMGFLMLAYVMLYPLMKIAGEYIAEDVEVENELKELLWMYMFIVPGDFMQSLVSGFVKGVGKEKVGSVSFVTCFYAIGLPLALILGNALGYYTKGLLIGMGIAIYVICVVYGWIVCRTNLGMQIKSINERLEIEEGNGRTRETEERRLLSSFVI